MKTIILFSVLNMLINGHNFKYRNVIVTANGTDNFTFKRQYIIPDTGNVFVYENLVIINDKCYLLKSTSHRRFFRSGNVSLRYIYNKRKLSSVQLRRCSMSYLYAFSDDYN